MRAQAGFTLVEMVCMLALVALLAALVLPAVPRATSRAGLQAYATAIAAMLVEDRNAAIRERVQISTSLDSTRGAVSSGANREVIRLPGDVTFDAFLPRACHGRAAGAAITFFPSGISCGGAVALTRLGTSLQISVNWLTGSVEVVETDSDAK